MARAFPVSDAQDPNPNPLRNEQGPYIFNLIMDVISAEVRDEAPLSMLFADNIILRKSQHENVEKKLEEWRKVMEERGLKISRKENRAPAI